MIENLIIYHANCIDGFTAAWVVERSLGNVEKRLFAAEYGSEPPWELIEAAHRVIIVDFSYPRAQMEAIALINDHAGSMICLDHHATAKANLGGLPYALFNDSHCGAKMAYIHFHADHLNARWLIDRVNDNDTGQRVLPHASEFSALIGSYPFTLEAYDELNRRMQSANHELPSTEYYALVAEGAAIKREQTKRQDATVELANAAFLNGSDDERWPALLANCSDRAMFSSVGVRLARKCGIGGCYFVRADGKVEFSLRSLKPDDALKHGVMSIDVSDVAKTHGGGGHKHAAGFVSSVEELTRILKER